MISAVEKRRDLNRGDGRSAQCLVSKVLKKKKKKTLNIPKANQINGRLFENDMNETINNNKK